MQFFRETLEPRIGLETERGALTFSLVKHIGLGVLGCLIVAITMAKLAVMGSAGRRVPATGLATVLGTYLIPQIVYRKTNGHGLVALVPLFRVLALVVRPLDLERRIPAIAVRSGPPARRARRRPPRSTSKR